MNDILNEVNGVYMATCRSNEMNDTVNDGPNKQTVNKPRTYDFLWTTYSRIIHVHNILFVSAGIGCRHIQVILLFTGLLFAYALRVNISVGIVAMTDKSSNSTHAVSLFFINPKLVSLSYSQLYSNMGKSGSEMEKRLRCRFVDVAFMITECRSNAMLYYSTQFRYMCGTINNEDSY